MSDLSDFLFNTLLAQNIQQAREARQMSHLTDWAREDYRSIERRERAGEEQQIALAVRDLETDRLMRKAFKALEEDSAPPRSDTGD